MPEAWESSSKGGVGGSVGVLHIFCVLVMRVVTDAVPESKLIA